MDFGKVLLSLLGNISSFRQSNASLNDKLTEEFSERGLNIKWYGGSGSSATSKGTSYMTDIIQLDTPSDFKNGQDILILNAGDPCSLTVPTFPATPITRTGATGSTSYQYQISAIDDQGGMTSASSIVSITNGAAYLNGPIKDPLQLTLTATGTGSKFTTGNVFVAIAYIATTGITNFARSSITVTAGQNITFPIYMPIGAIGANIYVGNTGTPLLLGTIFADGSTPVYSGGKSSGISYIKTPNAAKWLVQMGNTLSVSLSDLASETGDSRPTSNTIQETYNTISWNPVTGAAGYAVYGRSNGKMNLLAITTNTTWDDKGGDVIISPSTILSTPPATMQPKSFVATIISGGGSRTLKVSKIPGVTITNATIYHDDTRALRDTIATSYSGKNKKVRLPYGTYRISSRIVIPETVTVVGDGWATLDYTHLPATLNAMQINNLITSKESPGITKIIISGPGYHTSTVGVDIIGCRIGVDEFQILKFGTGLRIANSTTYINTFRRMSIFNCNLCLDADLEAANTTNAGEKIIFQDCVLYNSNIAMKVSSNVLDIYFNNSSIDYCGSFGIIGNAIICFSDSCHLETRANTMVQNYLFDVVGGARMRFSTSIFDLYGVSYVISTMSTSGNISFNQCYGWFRPSGGNTDTGCDSENQIFFNSGTTTAGFDTPFGSRITVMSILPGANTLNKSRSVLPVMSFFSPPTTRVTLTFDDPVPTNQVVSIRFG